jgi:hypothetical protein
LTKKTFEFVTATLRSQGRSIPRRLTAEEQKTARQAEVGMSAVMDMENFYRQDPKVLLAAATPTSIGRMVAGKATGTPAAQFETARQRALDPEVRAATGAALNKEEQRIYGGLQPKAGDDEATVTYKLAQLKALYAGLAGIPVTIRMPDGKTFDVQDTFNAATRHKMREAIRRGGEPLF